MGALVDYKSIPCIFIFIPLVYVVCFVFLPNTPQYYLQSNQIQVRKQQKFSLISNSIRINSFDRLQRAQESLKYYKDYKGKTDFEIKMFSIEFERLKSIAQEQKEDEKFRITDFSEISTQLCLIIEIICIKKKLT